MAYSLRVAFNVYTIYFEGYEPRIYKEESITG